MNQSCANIHESPFTEFVKSINQTFFFCSRIFKKSLVKCLHIDLQTLFWTYIEHTDLFGHDSERTALTPRL